jgi:putative Holliday junction resolvase
MGGSDQRRGCVLGLDYGSRRIGLAVSDEARLFAFPAGALERSGLQRDLAALASLIAERGVTRAVVGLPLHLSGRSGPEAEAARAFASALGEAAGIEVDLFDERWTTREAERALREVPGKRSAQRGVAERSAGGAGRSRAGTRQAGRKRERGSVDSVAATLLLRSYLERERRAEGGSSE